MITVYFNENSFLKGFSTLEHIISPVSANNNSYHKYIFCDIENTFSYYHFISNNTNGVYAIQISGLFEGKKCNLIFIPRNQNEFYIITKIISLIKNNPNNRQKLCKLLLSFSPLPIIIGNISPNNKIIQDLKIKTEYFFLYELSIKMAYGITKEETFLANIHEKSTFFNKGNDKQTNKLQSILNKIKPFHNFNNYFFPSYSKNDAELLKKQCFQNLKKIQQNENKKYKNRLIHELNIIDYKKLNGYFLIIADIVNWARQNMPVGTIRGSIGGSLVAYLLNITTLDPIKYQLMFERFLTIERNDLPDIDLDFSHKHRDKIFKYIGKRFGENRTAHLSTIVRFGWRGAFRYLQKKLNWDVKLVNKILPHLPNYFKGNLKELFLYYPIIKDIISKNLKLKLYLETASYLINKPYTYSVHPSGIFIANQDIFNFSPKHLSVNGEYIAHITKDSPIKILKIDCLGSRYLDVIFDTMVENKLDINNFYYQNKLNDKKTYNLLKTADTIGVFQLESNGIRNYLKKISPRQFEDIVAIISLYRPGPLNGGIIDEYIDRKNHKKKIIYHLNTLKEILNISYGLILFQEQVMDIAVKIGKLTWDEANLVRKAMAKRKYDLIHSLKGNFLKGAIDNGHDYNKALHIWNLMEKFAGYGFNRSHAIGFGYLTYLSAFLKTHYPLIYYKNLINNFIDMKGIVQSYIFDAMRHGIEILPPDINKSELLFSIKDNKLIMGFLSIKNINVISAQKIIQIKKKLSNPIKSFENFIEANNHLSSPLNKDIILSLIQSGAFSNYGKQRELIQRYFEIKNNSDFSLFSLKEKFIYRPSNVENSTNDFVEYTLHLPLTSKYLNSKLLFLNGYITKMRKIKTKTGKDMIFAIIENEEREFEITMFPHIANIYLKRYLNINPITLLTKKSNGTVIKIFGDGG